MAETTELKVVVSMVDQISGKLKATQDRLAGFSDGARKVGTAFTAVGGVIVAGLGASVMAAADAEKSQKQLEHATLNVAHGTREQLSALEETSAALQKKGVLDGDNIKMGQAQLMTFGLSADMVNQLSGSMADLAVNQFGANATGEDMTQTANMMAKALNGQFGVLEKSGIRFTEAQQKMIQFGTETERAAALQEGFAQNLKYTNEVAAGTLEGQVAKLNVQFGDLVEQIGGALMPVVSELVTKIQPVIQKVMDWISNNEKLTGKIILIGAAIGAFLVIAGPLLIMLSFLPALIGGVGIAFAVLISPIFLVGAAIAALIVGIVLLVKNWDWVKSKANEFKNAVFNSIKSMVDRVSGVITNMVAYFGTIPLRMEAVAKDMMRGLIVGVQGMVSDVVNSIANVANSVVDKMKSVLGIHSPSTVFKEIGQNSIQGLVDGVFSKKQDAINANLTVVKAIVDTQATLKKAQSELNAEMSKSEKDRNKESIMNLEQQIKDSKYYLDLHKSDQISLSAFIKSEQAFRNADSIQQAKMGGKSTMESWIEAVNEKKASFQTALESIVGVINSSFTNAFGVRKDAQGKIVDIIVDSEEKIASLNTSIAAEQAKTDEQRSQEKIDSMIKERDAIVAMLNSHAADQKNLSVLIAAEHKFRAMDAIDQTKFQMNEQLIAIETGLTAQISMFKKKFKELSKDKDIKKLFGSTKNFAAIFGNFTPGANIPGFAKGVNNFKGGWATVGEEGPETVYLPKGSSVIPNGQTAGKTFHITINEAQTRGDWLGQLNVMLRTL